MGELRVLDFGPVSPLRSQTLWHAVAYGVSAGAPPTLSFTRTVAPYASIGFHRRLEEVDGPACATRGVPIYRRMVGGGPVYLDGDQQLFQITLPAGAVAPARLVALRALLGPAVDAFRAAGVDARLDDHLEISVGDRKVCGHGAGQIEEAVVVCGNLIEAFDHGAAARVLAVPDDVRREVDRLMRRYLAATPADPAVFRAAAVRAYADALGLTARVGELSPVERDRLDELDARFVDPAWLAGPTRAAGPVVVKVRAGVWVAAAEAEGSRLLATVRGGRVERVRLYAPGLNGSTASAESAVRGAAVGELPSILAGFGPAGHRLAAVARTAIGRML